MHRIGKNAFVLALTLTIGASTGLLANAQTRSEVGVPGIFLGASKEEADRIIRNVFAAGVWPPPRDSASYRFSLIDKSIEIIVDIVLFYDSNNRLTQLSLVPHGNDAQNQKAFDAWKSRILATMGPPAVDDPGGNSIIHCIGPDSLVEFQPKSMSANFGLALPTGPCAGRGTARPVKALFYDRSSVGLRGEAPRNCLSEQVRSVPDGVVHDQVCTTFDSQGRCFAYEFKSRRTYIQQKSIINKCKVPVAAGLRCANSEDHEYLIGPGETVIGNCVLK